MIGDCENCDRRGVPVSALDQTTQCFICQGDIADPYGELEDRACFCDRPVVECVLPHCDSAKTLVDAGWLRRKTETDPDVDCEARCAAPTSDEAAV